MAEYASGSIHFSGLGSDTDFDDMINKLYKIESRQAQQMLRWKADWQKRLDAFQQVRLEVLNLQSALTAINSADKFLAKLAVSSKSEVVAATAGPGALEGVYNLEVDKLATNSIWSKETGMFSKNDVVNSTGVTGTFTYTYKGKQRNIQVPHGTTLEGLKNFINNDSNNPGVKAQLVNSGDGIVFQLRGMDTGKSASLVIDSTTNLNGMDVQLTRKWEESANTSTLLASFASGSAVINSTGSTKTFMYSLDGGMRSINVDDGDTLQDLVDKINAKDAAFPNLASLVSDGSGGLRLQLSAPDYTPVLDPNGGAGGLQGFLDDGYAINPAVPGTVTQSEVDNTVINTGSVAQILEFTLDGTTHTITVDPGEKASSVLAKLNNAVGDKAKFKYSWSSGDNLKFSYETVTTPHRVFAGAGSLTEFAFEPPTSDNWLIQNNDNGKIRLNGWPADPAWLEVQSNTVSDLVEGMTFNLRSAGKTTITVDIDETTITENVQKFVDAVNNLRTVLASLTTVDKEKQVLDPEYAESQFEMQKGSVLTGNYGIQLLDSRISQAIAGKGQGFTYSKQSGSGNLVGDLFSSLSQIGITTNAQEGHTNFGLLEINTVSNYKGSMTFAEALKKDPEAVAKLFAAKSEGASDSPYFVHNSHVVGVTKPGSYDVEYTTDASGNITSATINGKPASVYTDTNQIGLFSNTQDPADGIILDVYDLTPNSTMKGTVNIRNGKVNELLDMMSGSEGLLGEKGTLKILESNYQSIMDGIDTKVKKEDERLVKWERTMRLKFSRLEAVLSKYNSINEGLKTQLAQLGNNSK